MAKCLRCGEFVTENNVRVFAPEDEPVHTVRIPFATGPRYEKPGADQRGKAALS
jgi:hypothetical protein